MSGNTLAALAAAFGAVIFGMIAFSLQTSNATVVRAGGTLTRIRVAFTALCFVIGLACLIVAVYLFVR